MAAPRPRRALIKDPGDDPVIAMTRDRRVKALQNESQKLVVDGLTGAVLHKMLELKAVERDIRNLEEGVQEYQDQINLANERKRDIQKSIASKKEWCETFDHLIGPFEAKYEECKAEVKVSFDYAKVKYHESLKKLIDDFGFNPTYKRWFDEF
jgi:chromosome segregation ATPase